MSHEMDTHTAENLFAQLINITADAVIAIDHQQHILLFNKGAERIFGYNAEDVTGQPLDILLPEAVQARHRDHVQGFATESRTSRRMGDYMEVHGRRKDGTTFLADATITRTEGEAYPVFMVVLRDVTERKQIIEQLRYQENLLKNVSDAIISTDLHFQIVTWNTAAETIYGWESQEVVERILPEVTRTRYVHPGSREDLLDALHQHRNWHGELIQEHQSGRLIYVRASIATIEDNAGHPIGYVFINHDITNEKKIQMALAESETRYRIMAEYAADLITRYDLNGICTYASPNSHSLIGYHPEDLVGMHGFELVHPDDKEAVRLVMRAVRDEPGAIRRVTFRVPHRDGHYSWFEMAARSMPDPQTGQTQSVIAISRNVTQRKRLEQELRGALRKERELSELKLRFTSMVSHEFRTPLTIIMSSAEILKRYGARLEPENYHNRLDRIIKQTGYMRDLMEDVMLMSRVQSGRLDFNPAELDVVAFCHDIFDQMRVSASDAHQLVFRSEDASLIARLDERMLQQIIVNLVSNAIRYSPDGGTIELSLARQNGAVIIRVRDEGIGIPAEDQQHLFDPFHRASNTGTINGTGLGLTIVENAVRIQNGTIDVHSIEGKGTTFTVRLPVDASNQGLLERPGH